MAKPVKTRTVVSKVFAKDSEVNANELPKRLKTLQEYLLDAVENDCRLFASRISDWKENAVYKHFNPTWESFVNEHIKQPLEWIDHIIEGVTILDQSKPIKAKEAIAAAQSKGRPDGSTKGHSLATLAKAEKAVALTAQGMPQKKIGEEIGVSQPRVSELVDLGVNIGNKRDNVPIKSDNTPPPTSHRGNSKTHTIARLKRDGYADLAQQVESGQLPAAAARRQAGFPGADRKNFSVGKATNPQDFALKLADELPREFLVELTAALNELILRGG